MLSSALLLALSAHAAGDSSATRAEVTPLSSSTAQLDGEVCFSERDCRPYTLELDEDGTFADSLGRRGTWQPRDTGKTLDLQLAYTTGDDVVLGGTGEPDCWADPGPSVNPAIGEINVCMVVPHTEHNFDDQACAAPGTINIVLPYPEEDGHWSAGRLTPTVPMWVTSVEYHLNHNEQDEPDASCGQVAHSYEVFLGAADAPPDATPTPIASGFVSVAELGPINSHIEIELSEPVWLDTDDSLFVSVEMLWDGDIHVCRFTCPSTFEPGLGYWSYAVDTPYAWQDLTLDDVSVPMVTAYGLHLWP